MFTYIEFCAGCGGLTTGLENAGLYPLLINEIVPDFCETLKDNHKKTNIVCSSMKDAFDANKNLKPDVIVGGVPCQSFSMSGNRCGLSDPRGNLMIEFIDIVHHYLPKLFLIENVKGLTNHNKGETLKEIITYINSFGKYNITYKILNAYDYEVPQKRERIFIIGTLKRYTHQFKFPNPSKKKIVLKDILTNVPESECAKYSEYKIKLYKHVPQGGCWVNLPEKLQKEYMKESYNSTGGRRGILYRLAMEKPSLTLLCSPTQKQTERCHPLENRPLSVREYARIQTFPDKYIFHGTMAMKYKQIGNAVPVKLAEYVGKSIIEFLKKCD